MNPYNHPLTTYKHNNSDTFVHVQLQKLGFEFLLSTGLYDQYYFRFNPYNEGDKLISIHDDSHLYVEDPYFNSIMQVLSTLPSLENYNIDDILTANDYSQVDTFSEPEHSPALSSIASVPYNRTAFSIIASVPYIASQEMLEPENWYYYAKFPSDESYDHIPKREIYRKIGSLIFKYDSPDNTQGLYANGVLYLRPDGTVNICDDSMLNVELPYPLYGNLINVIEVDDNDRCINQDEYEKYCKLAQMMPLPQHQYRKPI